MKRLQIEEGNESVVYDVINTANKLLAKRHLKLRLDDTIDDPPYLILEVTT